MIFKKSKKFTFKFKKLFLLFLLLIISGVLFLMGERKDIQNTKKAEACWNEPAPSSSSSGGCAGIGNPGAGCSSGGGGCCGNGY